jgi:assimilatory nitrate reductase catalytic subunit
LKPLVEQFDYATLAPAGRDEVLVTLRGYCFEPVPEPLLDQLDSLFELTEPAKVMRYVDARRRVEKAARIDDGLMTSVCLSGETAAAEWLKGMMLERASLDAVRPWILAPVSSPPQGSLARGAIICNCLNVAENEIKADAAAGLDFAAVQAKRKCGTSCGSCTPEVKRIIARTPRAESSGPNAGPIAEPARVLPQAA